jgi:cytochrome c-type biogenesis protein CcmH/NrfG
MTDHDRALAPLNAVIAAIDSLDTYRTTQELAESLQAIGQAVERSLRQLLRASTDAPDALRLAALSPADLPFDRLIAELRTHNIISLPLAGMVHELGLTAARAANGDVHAADADRARAAVDRMRTELTAPTPTSTPTSTSAPTSSSAPAPRTGARNHALGDVSMRAAATAAVARGDIREQPHAITISRRALRSRAALPLIVCTMLVVAGWLLYHFVFAGPSAMDQGIRAFEQKRLGIAEQNFRAELDRHPDNVTASLYLGRVLRVEGRARDAGVVLNAARRQAPADADVLRELGHVFMDLKQPASAVIAYRQAQALDPAAVVTWVSLVRALRAAGDPSADLVASRAPREAQNLLRGNRTAVPNAPAAPNAREVPDAPDAP